MLDFIGYAPIFVDFSGRFNNRAIRMIEYLSNTGSPLASKSFGLIRCYSGECGYVAILFSQLSHRHILLQIHPFAKIFTEVTSPKSCVSTNSTIPAYSNQYSTPAAVTQAKIPAAAEKSPPAAKKASYFPETVIQYKAKNTGILRDA